MLSEDDLRLRVELAQYITCIYVMLVQCIPAFDVLFGGRFGCDTCGHGKWSPSRCAKWIKSAASAWLVHNYDTGTQNWTPQNIVLLDGSTSFCLIQFLSSF